MKVIHFGGNFWGLQRWRVVYCVITMHCQLKLIWQLIHSFILFFGKAGNNRMRSVTKRHNEGEEHRDIYQVKTYLFLVMIFLISTSATCHLRQCMMLKLLSIRTCSNYKLCNYCCLSFESEVYPLLAWYSTYINISQCLLPLVLEDHSFYPSNLGSLIKIMTWRFCDTLFLFIKIKIQLSTYDHFYYQHFMIRTFIAWVSLLLFHIQ